MYLLIAAKKIISTEIGGIAVLNVHQNSIELRWPTTGNIPQDVEKYIGFYIFCEVVGNPTTNYRCLDMPYIKKDSWVYGTVGGLEENSEYTFKMVSYRKTTEGKVIENIWDPLYITVATIAGKLVTELFNLSDAIYRVALTHTFACEVKVGSSFYLP